MQSVSKAAIDMANKTNGTTVELNNLSTNSQIGKAALEGLALAGNAIASWALAQVISLIVSGLDSLIHAVDIAKDKLDESSDTYHSTSSELENLNEELLDTTDRMKELETGGISLIEEDEYNKLSAANDELERTIALKKIEKQFSANETAEDAVNLYSKLTKKGQRTPSQEQIDVIKDNNSVDNINKYTISYGKDDLTSLLANYSLLQEAIDKTKSEMSLLSDDTTEEGQKKLKDLNKSLETYEDYLAKTGTYINTSMQNYQKVFDELSVIKNDKGELSQSEQEALDGADNALSLILNTVQAPKNYEALDSDPQRNVISQKLQEKGISTYNADTVTASLTEEELKIVGNIDFNKVDSVESFKQALEAIKHDAENPNNALELPFSDTLSELDAKIKPALESIGNVYKEIFTYDDNGEEIFSLDNIDFDTFTSIKEGLEEIQKAGGEIDISAYENLISVLSDSTSTADEVHDAFNEMASSLFTGLSNVTNANYDLVTSSLESMGITNAQIISFNALTNNVDALKEADFDLLNADESQINSFVNKHVAAEYASQAYDLLCLKQILYNNTPLNTDKDIENILSLAESAGFASDLLAKLSNVKAFWDTAMASGDARAISEANRALHDIKEQIKTELANFSPLAKVSNNASAPVKQATNSTPKETTDPHVTDFDEKYDKLKDLRDRDILNEKQYLDALRALNEKYYKNDKKYTDQYEKYKKEYLDGMLSLHESVISIATKQIDKYISSLEDQKGAAVDSLKEQQDAAKEALEAQKDALEEQIKLIDKQIDAKQAEIDAINEENEAHENTINLEKEQYELERLRNQRTEFTYSGKEKGFVYRTDTGAIRDQEQNVKEAEDKIRIAGIEKEISLLEKQKDALKDQQDAIDEQIDKVDEYYGKIIEDTETYWDGMIQGAENAKSEWEKMGDAIEEAEDKVKLASVGIDPDDPNALLSEETIRNFKEMHDSLMADVYAGNSEMLNALSELENVNLSSLTGYLSDTQEFMEILAEGVDFENLNNSLGSVMDQFSKVAEAAGMMTGSVVGTTGVSVGKNNGTNASPSQGSGNGNISFIDAVAGLEKESVPMLNNVADAFAGGEDSEDSTQSIAGSVEAAKAAIAGSSSGKKSSAEGENSSGEDSGSLMEAMAAQSQAALDEETGIPAQIQKWQELNGVLSGILENLRNIAAIIPLLNPQDGNFSVTSGTTGITQANGGLSHGDKNAMVSEYGQLETIIRRNGTYQITSSPTLTDLNPGDIVLNNSKTLALIRSKRRAASSGVKNLSLASPVLFSSALPELQPRNSVLAQSNAAAASPIFADNHQDNKIDVTIGDIILENVRDTDTLSRQIVMRLPTQIKQELSKRG